MDNRKSTVSVLMVCLGNICRSPTAEGVFAAKVAAAGLGDHIVVDSAGTAGWHAGKPPDPRAQAAALRRGVDISTLRARQVTVDDFARFDYILAMDADNLLNLQKIIPDSDATLNTTRPGLFLDYARNASQSDVPDPYYGGEDGFEFVLDLVESASNGLIERIQRDHDLGS